MLIFIRKYNTIIKYREFCYNLNIVKADIYIGPVTSILVSSSFLRLLIYDREGLPKYLETFTTDLLQIAIYKYVVILVICVGR